MIAVSASSKAIATINEVPFSQLPDTANYDRIWPLNDNLSRVIKNGNIGVINKEGAIVLPLIFKQVWDIDSDNRIRVLLKNKMGLYNLNGDIVIPAEYDNIWSSNNNMLRVQKNGLLGYYTADGRNVIPCQYEQIWEFEDGMARAMRNGLIGYISEDGKELVPTQYQQIWKFENEIARVIRNGKIGYVNMQGVEVVPPIYSQIWDFEDGKAKAIYNGSFVYIDTNGNILSDAMRNTSDDMIVTTDTINTDKDDHNANIVFDKVKIIVRKTVHDSDKEIIRRKRKFTGHFFGVDLGFNSLVTSGLNFTLPDDYFFLDMNRGKSVAVSANILQFNTPLNAKKNMGLVIGGAIEWNNYRFDSKYILTTDGYGKLSYIESDKDIKKNKLAITYLTVPVLFEYQMPIRGKKSPLYFSAGPVVGCKLKAFSKVVYSNSHTKEKMRDNLNINDFKYGFMARAGIGAINLTASYYLSPLFEVNRGPEVYPVSLSLSYSFNL